MLKRIALCLLAIAAVAAPASAQLKVFNHLGADLSVGTTGIGLELSTPITDFVQMRAGFSVMPKIKFHSDVDGVVELTQYTTEPLEEDINVTLYGDTKRTQGDIIFNIYPFGRLNNLFVAIGAYFGGKKVINIEGQSDRVAELQQSGYYHAGYVEVGDYKVMFEDNGVIRGGLVAKSFRPYFGLGFGRACPGSRVGFMMEAGVQLHGKMKVCQGKNLDPLDLSDIPEANDWQKVIDKLTVYPMLKFTLTGRLF